MSDASAPHSLTGLSTWQSLSFRSKTSHFISRQATVLHIAFTAIGYWTLTRRRYVTAGLLYGGHFPVLGGSILHSRHSAYSRALTEKAWLTQDVKVLCEAVRDTIATENRLELANHLARVLDCNRLLEINRALEAAGRIALFPTIDPENARAISLKLLAARRQNDDQRLQEIISDKASQEQIASALDELRVLLENATAGEADIPIDHHAKDAFRLYCAAVTGALLIALSSRSDLRPPLRISRGPSFRSYLHFRH